MCEHAQDGRVHEAGNVHLEGAAERERRCAGEEGCRVQGDHSQGGRGLLVLDREGQPGSPYAVAVVARAAFEGGGAIRVGADSAPLGQTVDVDVAHAPAAVARRRRTAGALATVFPPAGMETRCTARVADGHKPALSRRMRGPSSRRWDGEGGSGEEMDESAQAGRALTDGKAVTSMTS